MEELDMIGAMIFDLVIVLIIGIYEYVCTFKICKRRARKIFKAEPELDEVEIEYGLHTFTFRRAKANN